MSQIQGALVGIVLVLSAVFVPMALLGGSTGEIYRQFSVTIVAAMALSLLTALSLTPALCATLLKPAHHDTSHSAPRFFTLFNQHFERFTQHYSDSTRKILRVTSRYMILYLLIIIAMVLLFLRIPTSFLPEEDQGVLLTMAQLPPGATLVKTNKVLEDVSHYYLTQEKVMWNQFLLSAVLDLAGKVRTTGWPL